VINHLTALIYIYYYYRHSYFFVSFKKLVWDWELKSM